MVRDKIAALVLFLVLSLPAVAQKNRYMVFFKDKTGTPFTVDEPSEFLSAKAIERRVRHNVKVTTEDLPVNPGYIQAVKNTGAEIYFSTRWMNGILVQCDATMLPEIQALPDVKAVELVGPGASLAPNGRGRAHKNKVPKSEVTDSQLQMLGIDKMHADGFTGEGVSIAILDAGFTGVNSAEPFNHIFADNRVDLSLSKDFVYNSPSVFQYDDHGTMVLSVIAALQPDTYTGGAPDATFQLYVTEEVPTEYRVEEYNWLFAAERADSAGTDIIQSSLGYNDFDGTQFDYLKSQMDGKTAVITNAAQMASDRGILVVVSAGNEGNVSWQIITAPADARGVLAVGSVNSEEVRSNSSSIGPTADNRIKPDVASMGVNTSVIETDGTIGKATGTSLAAPTITSLAAGVWQRYPSLTNVELMDAIRNSGSQSFNPDKFLGYGVPDYEKIVELLEKTINEDFFAVYPNPSFIDSIVIKPLFPEEVEFCTIEFISADGKSVYNYETGFSKIFPAYTKSLVQFASGEYFVRIHWNDRTFLYRFAKI
jgi:serine protease AprX